MQCRSHVMQCRSHVMLCRSHVMPCRSHVMPCRSHVMQCRSHVMQCRSHVMQRRSHVMQCRSHVMQCLSHVLGSFSRLCSRFATQRCLSPPSWVICSGFPLAVHLKLLQLGFQFVFVAFPQSSDFRFPHESSAYSSCFGSRLLRYLACTPHVRIQQTHDQINYNFITGYQ